MEVSEQSPLPTQRLMLLLVQLHRVAVAHPPGPRALCPVQYYWTLRLAPLMIFQFAARGFGHDKVANIGSTWST